MKANKKNKGVIRISKETYLDNYHIICLIFKVFMPLKIDFRIWDNIWYMIGVSKYFDEIKEGEKIPEYEVIFIEEQEGYTYKFKKIESE